MKCTLPRPPDRGGRAQAGLAPPLRSPLPQVVPDDRLVQALALVQELGHGLRGALQQVIFYQKLDPLGTSVREAAA